MGGTHPYNRPSSFRSKVRSRFLPVFRLKGLHMASSIRLVGFFIASIFAFSSTSFAQFGGFPGDYVSFPYHAFFNNSSNMDVVVSIRSEEGVKTKLIKAGQKGTISSVYTFRRGDLQGQRSIEVALGVNGVVRTARLPVYYTLAIQQARSAGLIFRRSAGVVGIRNIGP